MKCIESKSNQEMMHWQKAYFRPHLYKKLIFKEKDIGMKLWGFQVSNFLVHISFRFREKKINKFSFIQYLKAKLYNIIISLFLLIFGVEQ